jgi:hypothetical protein
MAGVDASVPRQARPTPPSPVAPFSRHMSDGHQQTALTQEFPFQVSPFIPTTAESGCNAVALSRQVRQS